MSNEISLDVQQDSSGPVQGDTALRIAARNDNRSSVTFQGDTTLHIAARKGDLARVTEILDQDRSLAAKLNKFGETALIIACKHGHEEIAKKLLEQYEKPEGTQETCGGGETSLLYAAVQRGCFEIVKAILDHRIWHNDLMTKEDNSGRCAIHVAAIKGFWDVINEFMSKMPNCVEIRSSDHRSVLHFAVEYNQTEIVRNLLAKEGVDRLKQLMSADHHHHDNTASHQAEIKEVVDRVKRLVSGDHDQHHNTALHLAASHGVDLKLLDLLLCSDVDIKNALNDGDMTALLDMNALNDEGMTALDLAYVAARDNPDCVAIVEKLKKAGVKSSRRVLQSNIIPDDIVNTHMVVASLIATVTFAAMFQVPGGIEDDKNSIHYGAAKLAFHKLFRLFIFSNTAAFATSLAVVFAWLLKRPLQGTSLSTFFQQVLPRTSETNLVFSIIWTIVAFVSATIIAIIPHDYEKLKSKDKEAFSKYKSFWQYEIILVIIAPYLAVDMFFSKIQISPSKQKMFQGNFIPMDHFLKIIPSMSTGPCRHLLDLVKKINKIYKSLEELSVLLDLVKKINEIYKSREELSVLLVRLLITVVFILCFTFK